MQEGSNRAPERREPTTESWFVVEAAGVEPASENVTGSKTTCLVEFMPWALPQDVRAPGSEPTRNR